jgi:hypothetical protein
LLGTLISLERAIALRWTYFLPAGAFAGAALLLAWLCEGVGELVSPRAD